MALSVYIRIIPVRSTRTLRSVRPVHHSKAISLLKEKQGRQNCKGSQKYSVVENNQKFTLNGEKSFFVDYEYSNYKINADCKITKNAPISRKFLLTKSAENKRRQ